MCGLAAIHAYHYAANPVDRAQLRRIRDHMAARGPDGTGEWFSDDGRIGLGHRRLAVIDPAPRAAQPMAAADGSALIVFNGEIYNFRELRAQLAHAGRSFTTESDTEVLLALYARDGDRMFDALRGMYAFALWDARRGALLLGRDPYGIKPLYYADDGWTLRVASQVKALRAGGGVSGVIEPAALIGFAMLGAVPEPFTLLQEVRSVPAGHWLWVDESGPRSAQRHFSIAECYATAGAVADPSAIAIEAVRDSVRAHLVSDVPVGAFLSAGVDSGALVAVMAEHASHAVRAVTVAFDEYSNGPDDEAPMAGELALRHGIAHSVRRVGEAEFQADLPRILDAMDQPSIDGFNTWFAAKAAREAGLKVAMSGIGGDELCGGYASFRDLPRWVGALRWPARIPIAGRALRAVLAPLLSLHGRISPKAAGMLELGGDWSGAWLLRRGLFMPWELSRILPRDTVFEGLRRLQYRHDLRQALEPDPGSDFARVASLEAGRYLRDQLLRDADWASMAHSLELRTPLVDATLLRRAGPAFAAMAPGQGKQVLARVPRLALPDSVVQRPKTGFQTPVAAWLSRAGIGCSGVVAASSGAGSGSRALASMLLAQSAGSK